VSSTERHAEPDLRCLLHDREGHHRINAKGGQYQGERRKPTIQHDVEAVGRQALSYDLLHRADVHERQRRVNGVHRRRKARSQEFRAGRRPYGHHGLRPRALCEWDVHLWRLGLTELLVIADIAEDSHDMPLPTRTGRKPAGDSSRQHSIPGFGNDVVHRDTLAHGIPAVQEEPHESFVDYGDTLGIYAITIGQRTALHHPDPEGLEEFGRHHSDAHAWP